MANPYYTPQSGLGSVGSYQISSIPWVSSSVAPTVSSEPLQIEFPYVTRFIVVKNVNPSSASLRVGFSRNGIKDTNNYFLLNKGESFEGDLRVTELYLLSDNGSQVSASVVVGLTGIDASNLPNSWSGSVGVG
jgi:hypothetical protein